MKLIERKQNLSKYLFALNPESNADTSYILSACDNILSDRKCPNLRTSVFDYLIAQIENLGAKRDFNGVCKSLGVVEHHFGDADKFAKYFQETGRLPRPNKKMAKLSEVLRPIAFQACDEGAEPIEAAYLVGKVLKYSTGADAQKETFINLGKDLTRTLSVQEISYPGEFDIALELASVMAARIEQTAPRGTVFVDEEMAEATLDLANKARLKGYYLTAQGFLDITDKFTACTPGKEWEDYCDVQSDLDEDLRVSATDSNPTLMHLLRVQTSTLKHKTQEMTSLGQ